MQNVFLRIHHNLSDLSRLERLESRIFQITRNAVADYFHKARIDAHDVSSISAPTSYQPADKRNLELAECLSTLVGQLPGYHWHDVFLYELEGAS